jgi:hypothetical protein
MGRDGSVAGLEIVEGLVMLFLNPKGIPAQSPGLRGTSYPGVCVEKILFNRNGDLCKIGAPPSGPAWT